MQGVSAEEGVGMTALFRILAAVLILASASRAHAFRIYAVDPTNNLVRFDSTTPGTIEASIPITGLQPTEKIQGIDFRPATAQLYALGTIGPAAGSIVFTSSTPPRARRLWLVRPAP